MNPDRGGEHGQQWETIDHQSGARDTRLLNCYDNFVADLKAKARVEVHEALLERIQVGAKPASAGGGGSVLGPVDPSAPAPGALRRPGRPATVLPKPAGAPN